MRNEQKNNKAYLASILTMLLLASSIPLLNTAQANMSDNVFLIGDSSNKSFASFNGTASYTVEVTSDSDISLFMGLRYIENSTEVIEEWDSSIATFIYAGQISTSNYTLDVGPGTHEVTISIEIPSNPGNFDNGRYLARFGFCTAPCDYMDTDDNSWFPRLGMVEIRDWVVLADEDVSFVDAGGTERLDNIILKNLLRDEDGNSVRLSQAVSVNTDTNSLTGGILTAFDDSGLSSDYDFNSADAGQNYITINGLKDEEIPLPLDVTLSPTTSVVYCPSTPSVIGFLAVDDEEYRQFEDGFGPGIAIGITANPYSLVYLSSDSISQEANTWNGDMYESTEVNFDVDLENGGNIYDSFDVSLVKDSNWNSEWDIVANLDGVLPFDDDVDNTYRTEELEYQNAASRPCNSLYHESDADRDALGLALKFTIPANAQVGETGGVTLHASSATDPTISTEQHFLVTIAQHYAVDLEFTSITTVETDPESTAQFNFTVTNNGNGEDSFNIVSTASSDWNPSLSSSMITLGVNEVYTGHMSMTVPEGMMFGDTSGAVRISAHSNGDPADEWDDEDGDGVWDQGVEQLTVDHNGNAAYDSGTHDGIYVQVKVSQVHDVEFNYYVNESKVMISTIEIYTDTTTIININATNVGNGADQIRFEISSLSTENAANWLEIVQDVEYLSPGDSVTVSIKATPYLTTVPDTYTFTLTAMSYGTINSGESQILTIIVQQRETLPDGGQTVEDIEEGGLLGIPGFELVGVLLSLAAISLSRRPKF